jgi:hypothetical protein
MHHSGSTGKLEADLGARAKNESRARSLDFVHRAGRNVIQGRRSVATKLNCLRRVFPL